MDAIDIVKVCVRRWYVMLPILAGAAGVSSQLAQSQETTYTAAASFGMVQPALTPGARDEANPLGAGGDVLIGKALEAQLNSRETQAELGEDGTRGWGPGEAASARSYVVRIPPFETTYEVRAWGEDEQAVRDVVERVIEAAPGVTDQLQVRANVPPSQRYRPFVLAPTQVDVLPTAGWVKLVVAVMGVGVLMGAAWSVVVDRGLRWRRQVKLQRESQSVDDAPAEDPPVDQSGHSLGHDQPSAKANGTPHSTLNGTTNGTAHVQATGRPTGQSTGGPKGRPSGRATTTAVRKPANRR